MSDPGKEFIEPAKEAFSIILELFRLDWLDNSAESYQALARVVIFIVMWVLIREILGRLGHISARSVNVIAFAIALMGTVFMPSDWLVGMGMSYAAIFTMTPILFIGYMGFRVARTCDTSHPSERLRFIFVYIILLALLVFIASHMFHNSTNQKVFDVSMDVIIWVMYAVTAIYLVLNLFTRGLGAGRSQYEGDLDGGDKGDEEKDEGRFEKDLLRAISKEDIAEHEDELVRDLSREDEAEDKQALAAGPAIEKDMVAGIESLDNANKLADEGKRSSDPTARNQAIQAIKEDIMSVQELIKRLKKRIHTQKRIAGRHRKRLELEKSAARDANSKRRNARRQLSKALGVLKKHKKDSSMKQALPQLNKLYGESTTLINENRRLNGRFNRWERKSEEEAKRFDNGLKDILDKLDKASKLLEHPTPDNRDKARSLFREMLKKHKILIKTVWEELQYDKQREQVEEMEMKLDSRCKYIEKQMARIVSQIAEASK